MREFFFPLSICIELKLCYSFGMLDCVSNPASNQGPSAIVALKYDRSSLYSSLKYSHELGGGHNVFKFKLY